MKLNKRLMANPVSNGASGKVGAATAVSADDVSLIEVEVSVVVIGGSVTLPHAVSNKINSIIADNFLINFYPNDGVLPLSLTCQDWANLFEA
jgi:hypothetical protein